MGQRQAEGKAKLAKADLYSIVRPLAKLGTLRCQDDDGEGLRLQVSDSALDEDMINSLKSEHGLEDGVELWLWVDREKE